MNVKNLYLIFVVVLLGAMVLQLTRGDYYYAFLDLLFAAYMLYESKAVTRVPGGFKMGRFELYITTIHEKGPDPKFVQYDKCPGGCKLVSVGRIGATVLGKECYPNEEEE